MFDVFFCKLKKIIICKFRLFYSSQLYESKFTTLEERVFLITQTEKVAVASACISNKITLFYLIEVNKTEVFSLKIY